MLAKHALSQLSYGPLAKGQGFSLEPQTPAGASAPLAAPRISAGAQSRLRASRLEEHNLKGRRQRRCSRRVISGRPGEARKAEWPPRPMAREAKATDVAAGA